MERPQGEGEGTLARMDSQRSSTASRTAATVRAVRSLPRKQLLCINHACPNLGLPYDMESCFAAGHYGVHARPGTWETQATGGYRHAKAEGR